MVAVLLPGVSATYGSKRFLFGPGVQPSEFAKLAVVIWTAMLVEKKGEDGLRRLSKGVLPFLLIVGALGVLAALEPDYSVALHFALLMAVVLYAGGARIGHFVFLSFASVPLLWAVVQSSSYAQQRIVAFLNPVAAASQDKMYQLTQSLVAAGSGGLFGVGFGEGRQQIGIRALSVHRLHRERHRRGMGPDRDGVRHRSLRALRLARLSHRRRRPAASSSSSSRSASRSTCS